MKHVVLIPAFSGPTAGYQAVLVNDELDEFSDQTFRDEIDYGPWSDAMLIARSLGIVWAKENGYRLARDF